MTPLTQKLLESADDPDANYNPDDFPYEALVADISAIKKEIYETLGIELMNNGNVQDATFLDELEILRHDNHRFKQDLAIRFSNFGRLFVIYSGTNRLGAYPVREIRAIVEAHGWVFVDHEQLAEAYEGRHPSFKGATWWERFFEYP